MQILLSYFPATKIDRSWLTPERARDLACSTVLMAFRLVVLVKEREHSWHVRGYWRESLVAWRIEAREENFESVRALGQSRDIVRLSSKKTTRDSIINF